MKYTYVKAPNDECFRVAERLDPMSLAAIGKEALSSDLNYPSLVFLQALKEPDYVMGRPYRQLTPSYLEKLDDERFRQAHGDILHSCFDQVEVVLDGSLEHPHLEVLWWEREAVQNGYPMSYISIFGKGKRALYKGSGYLLDLVMALEVSRVPTPEGLSEECFALELRRVLNVERLVEQYV